MRLPTFEESVRAEREMALNPLQKFILDNEPAGHGDVHFRTQLRAAIDYAIDAYLNEKAEQSANPDSL